MIEENLDPNDWETMRQLGHRMVDDMMAYLTGVRERPVWRSIPEAAKNQFRQPVPQKPEALDAIYREFLDYVLPYPTGNIHPRFWCWVMGTGTPFEALEAAITADKEAGHFPFCIIGHAGTVNTGAFDDLNALADIC